MNVKFTAWSYFASLYLTLRCCGRYLGQTLSVFLVLRRKSSKEEEIKYPTAPNFVVLCKSLPNVAVLWSVPWTNCVCLFGSETQK